MKESEVLALVTLATASCPSAQERDPEPIKTAWMLMLGDIPFPIAKAAVMKVCRSSKFFPSIAEIVTAAEEIDPRNEKLPTAAEAWEEVNRLIGTVGLYTSPSRPLKFSNKLVERAARAIGWRQLCESENPEADRAHFLRIYESMRAKHRDNTENEKALQLSGMSEIVNALAGKMDMKRLEEPKK